MFQNLSINLTTEAQLSLFESNEENIWPNKKSYGCWRIRAYEEIDLLIRHADIVTYMTAQRI